MLATQLACVGKYPKLNQPAQKPFHLSCTLPELPLPVLGAFLVAGAPGTFQAEVAGPQTAVLGP